MSTENFPFRENRQMIDETTCKEWCVHYGEWTGVVGLESSTAQVMTRRDTRN